MIICSVENKLTFEIRYFVMWPQDYTLLHIIDGFYTTDQKR